MKLFYEVVILYEFIELDHTEILKIKHENLTLTFKYIAL